MFCPKCGAELEKSDVFCYKCGETILSANTENEDSVVSSRKKGFVSEYKTFFIAILSCLVIVAILTTTLIIIESMPDIYDRLNGYGSGVERITESWDSYGICWFSVDSDAYIVFGHNDDDGFYRISNNEKQFTYSISDDDDLSILYEGREKSVDYKYAKDESQIGDSDTWYVEKGVLYIGSKKFSCDNKYDN